MAATIERLNALIEDQATKINYLYQQMEEIRAQAVQEVQAADSQNKGGAKGLTHAKHFNPGKYSNLRGDQVFLPWAGDVKIMALRYSKVLHDVMNRTD